MKAKIYLAVLIVLLVLSFTFMIRVNQDGYSGEVVDDGTDTDSGDTIPLSDNQEGMISESVLGEHNSLDDCWIAYDGKVYDITSFLPRHGGGQDKILPYCGSADEFEDAFVSQHGTSKVQLLMQVGTFIGDFDVMGDLNA